MNFIAVCTLGTLAPQTIHCGTGARRSREEYLAEIEFVNNGQEVSSILNGLIGHTSNTLQKPIINVATGRDCGNPSKVDNALVYK